MNGYLKKVEGFLIKLTFLQFIYLILAQTLLYKKEISPYLSRTIFSEGVFYEDVLFRALETLDQFTTLWYDM